MRIGCGMALWRTALGGMAIGVWRCGDPAQRSSTSSCCGVPLRPHPLQNNHVARGNGRAVRSAVELRARAVARPVQPCGLRHRTRHASARATPTACFEDADLDDMAPVQQWSISAVQEYDAMACEIPAGGTDCERARARPVRQRREVTASMKWAPNKSGLKACGDEPGSIKTIAQKGGFLLILSS